MQDTSKKNVPTIKHKYATAAGKITKIAEADKVDCLKIVQSKTPKIILKVFVQEVTALLSEPVVLKTVGGECQVVFQSFFRGRLVAKTLNFVNIIVSRRLSCFC